MRRQVRSLAAGAALSLVVTAAHAGSYLQSEGDLNYSTGLGYLFSDQEWDSDGNRVDAPCDSEYVFLSQYLEYGYSYYHTLYGGLNLARVSCGPDSKTGVGDVTAGIRGRLDASRNNRAWELELNIPTSRTTSGRTRLGCGAFGVTASVATREEVTKTLLLGGEIGVQFWESPLQHQVEGRLTANGSFGTTSSSRWKWSAELGGYAPLDGGTAAIDPGVSDCGTEGKLVRSSIGIGYVPSLNNYFNCGVTLGLWGEDSTRREGLFCGFSHLFKR